MSSTTRARGLDAEGEAWRLDVEETEDFSGVIILNSPLSMPLNAQGALELARWLQTAAQGLGAVVCTDCGPCDECAEEHRTDYHLFAKGYDSLDELPESRRLTPEPVDLAEVKKTIGPAGISAALALLGPLEAAMDPSEWTKTLKRWVTPQANRALDAGIAKACTAHRAVVYTPDEIAKLAEAFRDNPTPFGLGELLFSVLDVTGTVQGDTPA